MTRRGAYPGSFDPPTLGHLEVARAAREAAGLDRVDLIVSFVALDKEHVRLPLLEHRLAVLEELADAEEGIGVVRTEQQLLVDIARGYDAVIMGADKWHQIHEVRFYADAAARDAAVAALPRPLVVPRDGLAVPEDVVLHTRFDIGTISSTRARAGERELMHPAARRFDERTGAWTDPERYRRWLATQVGHHG